MTSRTPDQQATVFIVDDDASIRHAMQLLLRSVGLSAETFASAGDFLDQYDGSRAGCLILDIRMPGLGGLELQERLLALGSCMPIIFITGHADVPMAVEAMQKGAFDFIQKPFRDQELLERISEAVNVDLRHRSRQESLSEIEARVSRLTSREREVMGLVVAGKPNKVIAFELGTSQRTVEIHRSRVMDKMEARSLAELVRVNLQFEASRG
ncbi:MAG: response regulator transcription factor [Woeseia sp.]